MKRLISCLCTAALLAAGTAAAQTQPTIGVRAGIGTDINGGIAFGGGINFLMVAGKNHVELGVVGFGGSFEETSDNGYNEYVETTDILVIGALANLLLNYSPDAAQAFFVVGFGLASVSMDWKETSLTDSSLGTRFGANGSMQEEDGSGGGTVFNIGGGRTFGQGLDIRIEVPTIVAFAAPGEAAAVIPTFLLTAGKRF